MWPGPWSQIPTALGHTELAQHVGPAYPGTSCVAWCPQHGGHVSPASRQAALTSRKEESPPPPLGDPTMPTSAATTDPRAHREWACSVGRGYRPGSQAESRKTWQKGGEGSTVCASLAPAPRLVVTAPQLSYVEPLSSMGGAAPQHPLACGM